MPEIVLMELNPALGRSEPDADYTIRWSGWGLLPRRPLNIQHKGDGLL